MKLLIYSRGVYLYAIESPQAVGGAERQQWHLARALAARGHEVVVAVPTARPDELQPVVDGVHFAACAPRNTLLSLLPVLWQVRPDWWYWECASAYIGPLFWLARLLGIHTAFACALDTDCNPREAFKIRRLSSRSSRGPGWRLYAWGLRQADRIIVQHEIQRGLLPESFRSKAYLASNIVDIDNPNKDMPKEDYVAWLGVICEQKRPHLLTEIARRAPDVQFKVAGPVRDYRSPEYGPGVLKDWKTLDNLEYLGPLAPAEAIAFVGRSRLFLSTSSAEGLPNTMLEAWSGKVPVVALGVDPGDIITTYRTGVMTADVEDAARTLSTLMGDAERTSQLGMNGWQYVADHHSADYVSRQIETAFGLRAGAEQGQS